MIAAVTLPITALSSVLGMNVIVNDSTQVGQLVWILVVMVVMSAICSSGPVARAGGRCAGRRSDPGAPDLPSPPTLVVLDVDGTILTSAHEVGAATAAQVRRVRRAGVEVLLASSRGPRAMLPVVTALGLTDGAEFVGTQGALTAGYDTAGVLHVHDRRPAPVDAAHAVVAAATDGRAGGRLVRR